MKVLFGRVCAALINWLVEPTASASATTFRRFGVDQDGGVRVERLHVFQLLGLELLVDDAGAPRSMSAPVSRWM